MKVMNRLTTRSLKLNWKRTLITMLAIMISVAMVTAIAGFIVSFQDLNKRMIIERSGDWHVQYNNVTEEQMDNLKTHAAFEKPKVVEAEDGGDALQLKWENPSRESFEESERIAEDLEIPNDSIDFNHELLRAEGIIQSDIMNDAVFQFAGILILVIMVGSIVVISNAFYISASERTKQFGMVKSVGATKRQVSNSVLFEGFTLAALGIPLGLILGYLVEVLALLLANNYLKDMIEGNTLEPIISWQAMAIAAGVSLVTVLLSALFPAIKTSRISIIDSIRETHSVKIKRRKVKTSKLTKKMFGFEGTLASKNLKRSRGKYRATVISLVVSIVLFITVMSFGQQLQQGTEMAYEDLGFNAIGSLYAFDTSYDEYTKVRDQITSIEGGNVHATLHVMAQTDMEKDMVASDYKDAVSMKDQNVNLVSLSDNDYEKILEEVGLENADYILVNDTLGFWYEGRKVDKPLYTIEPGTEFTLSEYLYDDETGEESVEELLTLKVDAVLENAPKYLQATMDPLSLNIIVSKEVMSEQMPDSMYFVANADDPTAFTKEAEQILSDAPGEFFAEDASENQKMMSDMISLVKIFTYGFIGMLSLIAITSVIGTISTNINLRKQEFAMLRSVGMTDKGFSRMLNLESLFYGLKALIIGIPLGLLSSFAMYTSISGGLEFAYRTPWVAVIISIFVVMLLTFSTMHYARSKQKKLSIIDALRSDNI